MSHSSLSNQNHAPVIAQSTSEQAQLPQQSHWFSLLWNAIVRNLLVQCEPKAVQKRDRYGQIYYNLYDPTTKKAELSMPGSRT